MQLSLTGICINKVQTSPIQGSLLRVHLFYWTVHTNDGSYYGENNGILRIP